MRTPSAPSPHEKCAVRSFPLPIALTARLSPVVVLAAAGWALSSGPLAAPEASEKEPTGKTASQQSPTAPSETQAVKTYTAAPEPCDALSAATVKSLVPGAKTVKAGDTVHGLRPAPHLLVERPQGLRLPLARRVVRGAGLRRGRGEVVQRAAGGEERRGRRPGVGDAAYSVVNLTTEDKQDTREGVVVARAANALVIVTYNGSDFESKKAPSTDVINKGAIKAAKEAVAALGKARG